MDRPDFRPSLAQNVRDLQAERFDVPSRQLRPWRAAPDFAIVSADIMTAPAKAVRDMKALATFIGGREVWTRAQ